MLVLWIVGCSGPPDTKPKAEESKPEEEEMPGPEPVVGATPAPPPSNTKIGAPPLGDGPWTVKRGTKFYQIRSYDDDADRGNGWLEVADNGLTWLQVNDSGAWEVHVKTDTTQQSCTGEAKCRFIKIVPSEGAIRPKPEDVSTPYPEAREHATSYHAKGWYSIERGLRPKDKPNEPPTTWAPLARMYISDPTSAHVVTESLCFNTENPGWAERDGDGSKGEEQAADLRIKPVSLDKGAPTSADSCPDTFKASFQSYSITLRS